MRLLLLVVLLLHWGVWVLAEVAVPSTPASAPAPVSAFAPAWASASASATAANAFVAVGRANANTWLGAVYGGLEQPLEAARVIALGDGGDAGRLCHSVVQHNHVLAIHRVHGKREDAAAVGELQFVVGR